MKVPVTIERTPRGFRATCPMPPYNDVVADAASRAEAIERLRAEVTYRMEFCPCSTVPDGYLELDVRET